ncbi:hypothetical protein [uncultured Gammaproteobacteria bacterium]|nr:hypothetical protein [uncultured Gammaproteobacteria bacterium]
MISLNLILAGLRLGLKNRQVGEKWVSDDCSYLCKGLYLLKMQKKCLLTCQNSDNSHCLLCLRLAFVP